MSAPFAHAVILDAATLGPGVDTTALRALAQQWSWYEHSVDAAVADRIETADLVITNKAPIDADALAGAQRLRCICVAATGVDHVDVAAASRRGVAVCNCTGYATASVVQHTFALLMSLTNRVEAYHAAARGGAWSASPHFCVLDYPITELAGKTLGIVGWGTLGRAVAGVGETLGMTIQVAARPGSEDCPPGRMPLMDLLECADVVSLHCPLTPDTRGLIGVAELEHMETSAFLLNTARGALIDETALARALRAGSIAGAGLDVLVREPPPRDDPLLAPDVPNLVVTPHCAWASQAARQRLVDQMVANMQAFAAGRACNQVNEVDP